MSDRDLNNGRNFKYFRVVNIPGIERVLSIWEYTLE